jgi:hypothetical protein
MDVEIRSRLQSVLSVLEHEGAALDQLDDDRLFDVLAAMMALRSRTRRSWMRSNRHQATDGDEARRRPLPSSRARLLQVTCWPKSLSPLSSAS